MYFLFLIALSMTTSPNYKNAQLPSAHLPQQSKVTMCSFPRPPNTKSQACPIPTSQLSGAHVAPRLARAASSSATAAASRFEQPFHRKSLQCRAPKNVERAFAMWYYGVLSPRLTKAPEKTYRFYWCGPKHMDAQSKVEYIYIYIYIAISHQPLFAPRRCRRLLLG